MCSPCNLLPPPPQCLTTRRRLRTSHTNRKHNRKTKRGRGATDIINVKFSAMEEMQRLGNAQSTLGLIFGALHVLVSPVLALSLVLTTWPHR